MVARDGKGRFRGGGGGGGGRGGGPPKLKRTAEQKAAYKKSTGVAALTRSAGAQKRTNAYKAISVKWK